MGFYQNVPILLDNGCGYTKDQVDEVNIIARSIRNRFISKATQNQNPKPKIDRFSISKYSRVENFRDFLLKNTFNLYFILNPAGMEPSGEYTLVDFDRTIDWFNWEGSNSDYKNVIALSSLGVIYIDTTGLHKRLTFKRNERDWPLDENGNKIKYSVFIGGKIK